MFRNRIETVLEGEPDRVLKFPAAIGYGTHSACLGIRRSACERSCIRQSGRRVSIGVEATRRTEANSYSTGIGAAPWIAILRVIEQVEGINPELDLNPLT